MGNNEFNEHANNIYDYFASDSFKQLIHISKTIFIVYFVILYICFSVAAYFIFKKEDKNPYLAFIPFYNMYVLFGLIKIPGYLAFIPFINLVPLYLSAFMLTKEYKCSIKYKILSFIVPMVIIILISQKKELKIEKTVIKDDRYLKTVADIDEIEKRLEENSEENYDNRRVVQDKPIGEGYRSVIDNEIEEIEANAVKDDYYDDLLLMENQMKDEHINNAKKEVEEQEEMIDSLELVDMFDGTSDKANTIEDIITHVDEANNLNIIDNAEYKDVQEEVKDVANIAFGGIEQDTKIIKNRMENKDGSTFCPYCSTMLKSDSVNCPGCGKKVK